MTRNELLDLIPAYALGALDDDERAGVDALLAADAEARALLAEYREMTEALVLLTSARKAPAQLEGDLRTRLAASRQPPVTKTPAKTTPMTQPPTLQLPQRAAQQTWVLRALAVAAALIVVLGAVLVVSTLGEESPAQLFEKISAEDDAIHARIVADENVNAWGELVSSPDGTQAVLAIWALPQLNADQNFQVWLVGSEGTVRSGGIFTAANDGPTYVQIPFDQPVEAYQAVGISIEPEGGSPFEDRPSGPRVLRVPLPT